MTLTKTRSFLFRRVTTLSFSRLQVALLGGVALAATSVLPMASPATAVSVQELSHYVQPVHFIPADAPSTAGAESLRQAGMNIQRQWAGWGLTYRLSSDLKTVRSQVPCSALKSNLGDSSGNDRVIELVKNEMFKQIGNDPNAIYTIFTECADTGYWAQQSERFTLYYGELTRLMASGSQNWGVIGHELGHVVGIPHENCINEPNMAYIQELASGGYPTAPSKSLMCHKLWPNVNPPMAYQRAIAFKTACPWLLECAHPQGSVAAQPQVQSVRVGNLKPQSSGKCLQPENGGTANGTIVIQANCNGDRNQLVQREGNYFKFYASGKCLEVSNWSREPGGRVQIWDCVGGTNQRWHERSGSYSAEHSGQCLDVSGNSFAPGARLIQWPCNGQGNQRFNIG